MKKDTIGDKKRPRGINALVGYGLLIVCGVGLLTSVARADMELESRRYGATDYHHFSLNWAVDTLTPIVASSELKTNKTGVNDTGIDLKTTVNRFYSRASVNFSENTGGAAQKILTDPGIEGSRSARTQSGVTDDVRDLCIGLGYQIDLMNAKLKVAPLAGLSYHAQGSATSGESSGQGVRQQLAVGTSPDSERTIETERRSWFLGIDMDYEIGSDYHLLSSVEYHNADYETVAFNRSRGGVAHVAAPPHQSEGTGAVVNVGINRVFAEKWLIGLMYGWQDWHSEAGSTGAAPLDPQNNTDYQGDGQWGSQSINLSIGYNF
jgi:hypothetical protein